MSRRHFFFLRRGAWSQPRQGVGSTVMPPRHKAGQVLDMGATALQATGVPGCHREPMWRRHWKCPVDLPARRHCDFMPIVSRPRRCQHCRSVHLGTLCREANLTLRYIYLPLCSAQSM